MERKVSRTSISQLKLLGESVTDDHSHIKGIKLPTTKQVLMAYISTRNRLSQLKGVKRYRISFESKEIVYKEIESHYLKAGIKMASTNTISYSLDKIFKLYQNSQKQGKLVKDLEIELPKTCRLWDISEIERLRRTADSPIAAEKQKMKARGKLEFLDSMMSDRRLSYVKGKMSAKPPRNVLAKLDINTPLYISSDESDYDNNEDDPLYVPPAKKIYLKKKPGFNAFIPVDIMAKKRIIQGAQRNKISPTALSRMTKDFVASIGGDCDKINSSYSYAYNACKSNVMAESDNIKVNWEVPNKCVIHYDGKMMEALDCSSKEERFPVLVSGTFGTKLLGVPTLGHGLKGKYGATACAAVIKLLEEWKCKDSVFGMVFDTPKTNIGRLSGVCISIERALDRPLLWLACRHHVGETIIRNIWIAVGIEKLSGPKTTIFNNLSQAWSDIDFSIPLYLPTHDPNCEAVTILSMKRNYLRDDYKEVVDLTLIYLGAMNSESYNFRRPGALHQARWMAKVIYSFKLVMFSNQIELPHDIRQKLVQYCNFLSKVYVPWWINCNIANKAPQDDLKLVRNIIVWKSVDPIVANSALKATHRHLWYLSENLIPLALFDNSASADLKSKIAKEIIKKKECRLASSQQIGRGFSKIKPTILEQTDDLSTFVGRSSWTFFGAIGCKEDFLKKVRLFTLFKFSY